MVILAALAWALSVIGQSVTNEAAEPACCIDAVNAFTDNQDKGSVRFRAKP